MIEIIGTAINQWDSGRSVTVTDIEASHVHFANQGDSKAAVMELVDSQALIPDYLLQTGKQLCVYAVLNGVTVESRVFPVKKRERPENYVYEDDQRNYIYELITDAQEATKAANQVAQDLIKAKERGEFNGPKGDPGTALIDDSVVGETAWSSKNTVDKLCPSFTETGSIVLCEPVEGYPLEVTADPEAIAITRCGKNLFDDVAFYKANGFIQQEDGTWYGAHQNKTIFTNTAEVPGAFTLSGYGMRTGPSLVFQILYTDGTSKYAPNIPYNEFGTTVFTTDASKTVDKIVWMFQDFGNFYVRDFQVEYGSTATPYEPYRGPEMFNVGEPIPALPGVNTIYADCGLVTVTGRADPVAIINKLSNAVTAMSSDV